LGRCKQKNLDISVALALSVSKNYYGDMFVTITYIVVLFSILVQGLTISKVAGKPTVQAPAVPE